MNRRQFWPLIYSCRAWVGLLPARSLNEGADVCLLLYMWICGQLVSNPARFSGVRDYLTAVVAAEAEVVAGLLFLSVPKTQELQHACMRLLEEREPPEPERQEVAA